MKTIAKKSKATKKSSMRTIDYVIDYDPKNGSCDTVDIELPDGYTEQDVVNKLREEGHIEEDGYRSFEFTDETKKKK